MRITSSASPPPLAQRGQAISLFIDGRTVEAYDGETVAAVLFAENQRVFRRTFQRGELRSLFCGMGVCFDCLVTIDGQVNIRACLTPVEEGMRVETVGDQQESEVGGRRPEVGREQTINGQRPIVTWEQKAEVAVVGAGPAGLEAALTAAEAGAQVTLIDSSPLPGGQYFKQPPAAFQYDVEPKYVSELFARMNACQSLRPLTNTQVWGVFPGDDDHWLLTLHGQNAPLRLDTQMVILATGAYDRPVAFPGWTFPGVITAGAVQTLLKSQAVLPGRRFVLAGSGPLQMIVAAQLVKAGADVAAVLEAAPLSQFRRMRHVPAVWGQWARMQEGWSAWRTLRSAGVKIRFGWAMTEARGEEQVEIVNIAKLDENWSPLAHTYEIVEADTLVLGYGFLPATQLTHLLGCEHHYSPHRGGWIPLRDECMQTTHTGVYAVGDGAGIGGATLARLEGQVAGLDVAYRLGRLTKHDRQSQLSILQPKLTREGRFAGLLSELFTPRPGLYTLAKDNTIICRCEEVRLGEIRRAQSFGCKTLNVFKGLTRVGMGNCQGRICGDLLAHTLAAENPAQPNQTKEMQNLGSFSVRPPIFPMTIHDLAQSAICDSEIDTIQ